MAGSSMEKIMGGANAAAVNAVVSFPLFFRLTDLLLRKSVGDRYSGGLHAALQTRIFMP